MLNIIKYIHSIDKIDSFFSLGLFIYLDLNEIKVFFLIFNKKQFRPVLKLIKIEWQSLSLSLNFTLLLWDQLKLGFIKTKWIWRHILLKLLSLYCQGPVWRIIFDKIFNLLVIVYRKKFVILFIIHIISNLLSSHYLCQSHYSSRRLSIFSQYLCFIR